MVWNLTIGSAVWMLELSKVGCKIFSEEEEQESRRAGEEDTSVLVHWYILSINSLTVFLQSNYLLFISEIYSGNQLPYCFPSIQPPSGHLCSFHQGSNNPEPTKQPIIGQVSITGTWPHIFPVFCVPSQPAARGETGGSFIWGMEGGNKEWCMYGRLYWGPNTLILAFR